MQRKTIDDIMSDSIDEKLTLIEALEKIEPTDTIIDRIKFLNDCIEMMVYDKQVNRIKREMKNKY